MTPDDNELSYTDPDLVPYLEEQRVKSQNETGGQFLKNVPYARAFNLAAQLEYLPGQVISKTLVQNDALGITLFAMPAGEGISSHKSTGDAFVTVLEGQCEITIDDGKYKIEAGESIVMPAGHPHAVQAITNFKMLLVVVFPG